MGCPCEQCIRHSKTLGFRAGSASEAEIRKAYRKAAKAWHPDRFARDAAKRQEAEERFKQIQEAFRELIEHNPHGWAAPAETIASAPAPVRVAPRILFDGSYGCYSMPDVPPVAERIIARTLGHLDSALAILDLSGKRSFSEFLLLTTHGVMMRSELHIVSLVSYADVREVRIIDRNLQPQSGWWQRLLAKITNAGPRYALEIVKNDGTVFCSLDKQMNDGVKTVVYRFLLQQKGIHRGELERNMDWKSSRIDALLEQALVEDQAVRDSTTNLTIDPDLRATASIIARQEMVVAGLGAVPRFLEIFARLDPRPPAQTRFEVISHPEIFDGVKVREGQVLAVIRHNARVLLSCERVILNLMQHLSGIATLTRQYVDAIAGTNARVLDTRKTVPGLRVLEKYAVQCGGGTNHRLDLASGILIKNNHISLGGGLPAVLTRALERRKKGQRVQVEVRSMQELEEAIQYNAEAILLDNMTPAEVQQSVVRVMQHTDGKACCWIPIEASGGIVLDNIRAYAETGVEFISVGALTHSAKAADISMRIEAEPS